MRSLTLLVATLLCFGVLNAQQKEHFLDLPTFHSISLAIDAEVILTQSNKQVVKIYANQETFDALSKNVSNGRWNITYEGKSGNSKGQLKIAIAVADLQDISIAGSGNITTKGSFKGLQDFRVNIGGSGNINMDMTAQNVKISIGGQGNIILRGSSDNLKASIAGTGDIEAAEFNTKNCMVSIAGSGNCKVHASNNLNVNIAGSGDVHYKGNPEVQKSIAGSGELKSMN